MKIHNTMTGRRHDRRILTKTILCWKYGLYRVPDASCMPSMPSWDFFHNKFPTPVKTGRRRSREVPTYYSERMYQELAPMDIKLLTFIPLNHACTHGNGKFVGGSIWNVYRKFLKHIYWLKKSGADEPTDGQNNTLAACTLKVPVLEPFSKHWTT